VPWALNDLSQPGLRVVLRCSAAIADASHCSLWIAIGPQGSVAYYRVVGCGHYPVTLCLNSSSSLVVYVSGRRVSLGLTDRALQSTRALPDSDSSQPSGTRAISMCH